MRILVIGSGAREDALSWRLAQSPSCTGIFASPGNAGTAARGGNWDIAATNGKALVERARRERIHLVVVGPETAIAAGVSDQFRQAGFSVFGPTRAAGRLESSKVFSKRFMERCGIPTPRARVVRTLASARKELVAYPDGCVLKADGLAAGKGVVVVANASEALTVLEQWFGASGVPGGGSDILLEELLVGREVSVFAIGDGKVLVPVASACDYKRLDDGDVGPNTGGMGAYSPAFGFPEDLHEIVAERVLEPVLRGLYEDGESFTGVLYCGLMWTKKGPMVLEFNARFGDPETQVLMPRVRGDFALLLKSAADGALNLQAANFEGDPCVGVVLATHGYPRKNTPMRALPRSVTLPPGCVAFWGGSTLRAGVVDVSGGRVLTITAQGSSIADARAAAYEAVVEIRQRVDPQDHFMYRKDIAASPI
jgi:phosphoribosylamine---glycine ligase